MRNKIQPVVSPKFGENPGGTKRNSCGFSSFDRRRSSWFSVARMAGERRPASKLQIGAKVGRNGGKKWEIWPGHVRGFRVGFSRLLIASVTLTRVCICSLFLAYSILFNKVLNRLNFIFNSHMLQLFNTKLSFFSAKALKMLINGFVSNVSLA